jgi:ABC-2 type transport system permease protein
MTMTAPGEARHAKPGSLPAGLKVTQWGVIRSEWLKFWSLRSSWYSLIITVVGIIGLDCLFAYGAVTVVNRAHTLGRPLESGFTAVDTAMRGYLLAQLVIGVLGVLVVGGEYGTGMIRSSLAAAPRRLPVLIGKAVVFALITFVVTTISTFIAYFPAQPILDSAGIGYSLSDPGVVRSIFGIGFYLTVIGLIAMGLAWILRHTAAAIAALLGLLLVIPPLAGLLPSDWQPHITPYLPSEAGSQLAMTHPDPSGLAGGTALVTVLVWVAVAILGGAILLTRRDA